MRGTAPSNPTAAAVAGATTSASNAASAARPRRARSPGGTRVRQVHARQRRAELPRPKPRRRLRVPRERGNHLIAGVQSRAGEVREVPARRRSAQPGATSVGRDDGAATEDRRVHAPARRPAVPRPHDLGPARVAPQTQASTERSPTTRERSSCTRPRSTRSHQRTSRPRPLAAPVSSPGTTPTDGTRVVTAGHLTKR